MSNRTLPSLHWQDRSSLSPNTYQSLLISLLRGAAALQVALAHLRAEVFPSLRGMDAPPLAYQGLAFATGFAHQAVVLFFLISGWLVGGSLLDKWSQPQACVSYMIDRVTRLWTVMVPTMLLMVLAALYTGKVVAEPSTFSVSNDYSAVTLLGNLFGLQTILVSKFGGNYALWSLANETWYYVLFPLMLLLFRASTRWRQAASAVAIACLASLLPLPILLYFSLWLLGTAAARLRLDCSNSVRYGLLLVSASLSVYFRLTGSNDDLVVDSFVQDLVLSVPFLLFLASMHQPIDLASPLVAKTSPIAKLFSEFSFTLYVTHVPVIALLRYLGRTYAGHDTLSPYAAVDYLAYLGLAGALLAAAFFSYLLFESRTGQVRRFLKAQLLKERKPIPVSGVASVK